MIRRLCLPRLLYTFLLISLITLTAMAQRGKPPQQPNPRLTPGSVLAVTTRDICVVGYTKKIRNVPESVKGKVYAEYGILTHQPGEYEVDHLISLELGGSNAISNLWPQSYITAPYNAHIKDTLENKLHRMVCSGQMDLRTAQREIARDWIGAYHRYVLNQAQGPLASNTRRSTPRRAPSNAPRPTVRRPNYQNSNNAGTYAPPVRRPGYQSAPTAVASSRPRRVPTSQRADDSQPYYNDPRKPGYRRSTDSYERPDQAGDGNVVREEPPPTNRVTSSYQRKPPRRCKWKNIWCGFGLFKRSR